MIPKFEITHPRTLTKEESGILLQVMLAAKQGKEDPLEVSSLSKEFPFQVAIKRIEYLRLPFHITDSFMVASLATFVRSAGEVVMLVRLCYQKWLISSIPIFNIDVWVEMFPMGVPTKEDLETWWESQKIPFDKRSGFGDNYIDLKEEWPLPEVEPVLTPKEGLE